jgi:RNA polymerase sigma-70 factor (ECF subfamily)
LEPVPDQLADTVPDGPEARYDARESIALSFIAGLQHLPQRQRAVLVLRDVMGFPASEAAEMLGTTVTSVNSALIRAREGFRPERSVDDVPLPRSAEEAAVVEAFVDAFQRGDLGQVLAVLGDDAQLSMPPEPVRCVGAMSVVEYLKWRGFWGSDLHLLATRANGQPAFGYYLPDPERDVVSANGLMVLTVVKDRVQRLTRFGGAELVTRFGLPTIVTIGPTDPHR